MKATVYKHPHADDVKQMGPLPQLDGDNHFYEKSLKIKEYDVLHVQLSTHMLRGLMSPDIQLLNLTPGLRICLEHHR